VPALAYRLRAKLVAHGTALGLFERGSHRVIDVEGCPVLTPALTRTSVALRARLPLPIHGADLRETSEGVLVTLLSEQPRARPELERVARELVEAGVAFSVAIAMRRPGEVKLLTAEPVVVAGPTRARHALSQELPYSYATHGGFVQAHAGQASYVYAALAKGLQERLEMATPRVLELFAGSGALALVLAQRGARVTAVESYAPAIQLAEAAAREQKLELSAIASDAARFAAGQAPGSFDAVLVNPPRRGLTPELRRSIARLAPRVMAYVSCNPLTLARDAEHLAQLGLRLTSAEPLDMIPWSDALEALCWLEPAEPPPPRVLRETPDYLAIDKPAYGACWLRKHAGAASVELAELELELLVRGNLRKQGTITRRGPQGAEPGARYRKLANVGRHSRVLAWLGPEKPDEAQTTNDHGAVLRDFASIGHPVLGDAVGGDPASNRFVEHRHGLDRAFVHCRKSQLRLADGSVLTAEAELPPDLRQVLASLADSSADDA
jgi:23S rRNA (uracil1939-C5)-methyltransferase